MVGDVVGELHDTHADVSEDLRHLGVVAEHRAVLEAEHRAEHVVGDRLVHLGHVGDHPQRIGVVPAQVAEVADARHRSGEVLPRPDRGVDDVDTAGADLVDDRAGPVVDFEPVDDHCDLPRSAPLRGLTGSTQLSSISGPSLPRRGAP